MSCCTNILNLGCFYSCDPIETGLTATATGTWTFVTTPDLVKLFSQTITSGNSITFSSGYVNEDGVTVFKILKPNGDYFTSGIYDCFQIEVKPAFNTALAPECSSDGGNATVVNSDASYSTTVACGATLTLPDTTVNVYVNNSLRDTDTIVTLANETINIFF